MKWTHTALMVFLTACRAEKSETGPTTGVDTTDADGDGHGTPDDCDDTDALVYLDAV